MKVFGRFSLCLALLICGLAGLPALAQEGTLETNPPKDITPDEIIKRFSEKETEFAKARDQYTYRQDVKVQNVDGETVTGEYHEVFDVMFDDKGQPHRERGLRAAVEPGASGFIWPRGTWKISGTGFRSF